MRTLPTKLLLLVVGLLLLIPFSQAQTGPASAQLQVLSNCSRCYPGNPAARAAYLKGSTPMAGQHRTASAAAAAYVRSTTLPWGTYGDNTNVAAMDGVFGSGNWDSLFLETTLATDIFTATRHRVFLEGSELGAPALSSFLQVNQAAIENWVAAGGHLFVNAAPSVGGSINCGFGGMILNYGNYFSDNGTVVPGNPLALGPYLPAGDTYSGGAFAHAAVTGPGLTRLITGDAGTVLGGKAWGNGYVLVGGMTCTVFQNPSPNALNLRQNILVYTPATCTFTAPAISVLPTSTVYTGGVPTNLYLGYGAQSAMLTATGGVSYAWSPATGINNANIANPVFKAIVPGTFAYTVTVTNQAGCTAKKTVTMRVVDASCGNDKVLVCHNGNEICISANAVPAHLNNHDDDQLGACSGSCSGPRRPAIALGSDELEFSAAPNPFGASTTVHFRPTISALAQVRVFDALGREVATLFAGATEAGHDYSLHFEAAQLATGFYLCRYESAGQVHTQRLSVVK
ncbi:MAG: T9SS type A sorting domain-containing protein [Bacteroidota bacterium]|nr:T9SS type A sorting domain-containing protein [Bacteroidota bacterium]